MIVCSASHVKATNKNAVDLPAARQKTATVIIVVSIKIIGVMNDTVSIVINLSQSNVRCGAFPLAK